MGTKTIRASFLPLIDAAILIAAHQRGFAEEENLHIDLARETSWANVRDRMAIGHFDVAHMLAPMPLASNLGLTPIALEMVVPMAMGLGGNAVTVSNALYEAIGSPSGVADPTSAGLALKQHILEREARDEPRLSFGVVHTHSSHNFELRYWLSAVGIRPERDVELVILPPPYMVDALKQGTLDGYCVGEPWNSLARSKGVGQMLTTKKAIWMSSPEKVLGVREGWADRHPHEMSALLRSLYSAAQWCGRAENYEALADLLALPDYLNLDGSLLHRALIGAAGFEPFANAATFPWQSHALWLYSQMVRWGQVEHAPAHADKARRTYRPDLYRAALAKTDAIMPSASSKVEGALQVPTPVGTAGGTLTLGPDGFFDGLIFDPDLVDQYITGQRNSENT